jgi:hypothetical protein
MKKQSVKATAPVVVETAPVVVETAPVVVETAPVVVAIFSEESLVEAIKEKEISLQAKLARKTTTSNRAVSMKKIFHASVGSRVAVTAIVEVAISLAARAGCKRVSCSQLGKWIDANVFVRNRVTHKADNSSFPAVRCENHIKANIKKNGNSFFESIDDMGIITFSELLISLSNQPDFIKGIDEIVRYLKGD